jgi:hypothetical protein
MLIRTLMTRSDSIKLALMRTGSLISILVLLQAVPSFLPAAVNAADTKSESAKRLFFEQLERPDQKLNLGLAYWIELRRDGKTYRCNNKFQFKSGDHIRFHIIPNTDGYAYIVLNKSSSGRQGILFPSAQTGTDNHLKSGKDYALPTQADLQFDANPGVEKVSLIYSRTPITAETCLKIPAERTALVSAHADGAKDLVPTRMQLSWDDTAPVIIPEDILAQNASDGVNGAGSIAKDASELDLNDASLVTIVYNDPEGILSADVALKHL